MTPQLKLILFTPIRILGEGLEACLSRHADICLLATVSDMFALRQAIKQDCPNLVLIDVMRGPDLEEVRAIATEYPALAMALGLREQRQEVIRCGRAGFAGYVDRDVTTETLCRAKRDVATGRFQCSAEISAGLLRALFHTEPPTSECSADGLLTRREGEVLQLVGRGLSNGNCA